MTDFTETSHTGQTPPRQYKSGPGQIGVNAAMHQPRGKGESKRAGSSSRGGRAEIGAPSPDQAPEGPPDTSHLQFALEHEAAKTLGRDLPAALWAMRNGMHRHPYFDYLMEA